MTQDASRIWLSPPHMGGEEFEFVRSAFETNWLSTVGPNIDAFEREMGERLGRHCVALASGTSAIHLGLRWLGVGPDDEVLCPSLTFVASSNPILYLGAKPVLIDSERESWNLDPARLEEAIEARTRDVGQPPKALVVVHLYGQTANMDAIRRICSAHGVAVFEDAAEALGATYGATPAGALAPVGALSFNGNKIITTSGGGMLITDSADCAQKARFWSTQARDPGVAYEHTEMGYNYRMSNVLAGMGRGQLTVLDARVERRRAIFERYVSGLEALDGLIPMPEAPWGRHTRWLSTFTVDEECLGVSRDDLIQGLAEANIESRPVWKPMHLQPLYADAPVFGGDVASDLFRRGICLPSGSSLSESDLDRILAVLHETVGAAA
ncbi:MAG: aminotransferase class I/II-fold pyridoxal phosphate-dependent enzyme [Deltaproteobacteria bacterium]|nr:aminotransferase class I/II-fold pyridoxal phosphate-dependent enzyme [Deltaproteobacteria bacterium]